MSRRFRRLGAALAALAALPALAYLLPSSAVLRHLGQRRAALNLETLEVLGTVQAEGATAERLGAALAAVGPAAGRSAPARFLMKVPGRCRLEVGVGLVPDAELASVSVRDGKVTGHGGLDADPSAVALIRALCTALATAAPGDESGNPGAYAAALGKRGVALADECLGRFDGRLAYVIGGRPQDAKPLFFVDKDGFQPLRLLATEGGAMQDVRLLGWGSPTGGDWFPRAVEVLAVQADQLRLRFTAEKTTANVKIADARI
jgi:hypothetical protein